jgi:hypothetical protein
MISAFVAFMALTTADPTAPPPATTPTGTANIHADRFEGRPQARIAFARDIRNFQVQRDGLDDVLYLETQRNRWYRSEIICFGLEDPRDAHGIIPIDRDFGIERSSRIALVSFGQRTSNCSLQGLIELTPEEAVAFKLVRQRTPARPKAAPTS